MNARELMTSQVTTVAPEDSVLACSQILKEKGFKHLPVVQGGRLVGVVTDRDLKRVSASDATTLEMHELLYLLDKLTVAEVMTKAPVTAVPETPVRELAGLILERGVGCLPIVEGNAVVGIITRNDLIRLLARG